MKNGDIVKYVGKGFLSYDPNDPLATFLRFDGRWDAIVLYKGRELRVYTHEIEPVKKPRKAKGKTAQ